MLINQLAPDFETEAFVDNNIRKLKLSDYKGKWVVLFFYPADFTFVCPTELEALADNYGKFQEVGAEIISISMDTAWVHKAWHDNSPPIKKIRFPMASDPTGGICRSYGTYLEKEGLSVRATFFIDPDGIVKSYELNDNDIGRSTGELLRKLYAVKFVKENNGNLCPMDWTPGVVALKKPT